MSDEIITAREAPTDPRDFCDLECAVEQLFIACLAILDVALGYPADKHKSIISEMDLKLLRDTASSVITKTPRASELLEVFNLLGRLSKSEGNRPAFLQDRLEQRCLGVISDRLKESV